MRRVIPAAKHHVLAGSAIGAAILSVLLSLPASAQDNPLVQTGVPAEATAENAVVARERAISAAQRTAFERLASQMGITSRPSNVESLVDSLIVEEERPTRNGYSGRYTIRFNARRIAALGGRAPGSSSGPSSGGEGGSPSAPSAPSGADAAYVPPTSAGPSPASAYLDAGTNFRSLDEWVALRRRLLSQPSVSSVDIVSISVTGAVLRIGLRSPPNLAAGELAAGGIALAPAAPAALPAGVPRPSTPPPNWRVGLAGGA